MFDQCHGRESRVSMEPTEDQFSGMWLSMSESLTKLFGDISESYYWLAGPCPGLDQGSILIEQRILNVEV